MQIVKYLAQAEDRLRLLAGMDPVDWDAPTRALTDEEIDERAEEWRESHCAHCRGDLGKEQDVCETCRDHGCLPPMDYDAYADA
jgi:hypothetical protein